MDKNPALPYNEAFLKVSDVSDYTASRTRSGLTGRNRPRSASSAAGGSRTAWIGAPLSVWWRELGSNFSSALLMYLPFPFLGCSTCSIVGVRLQAGGRF